MMNLLLYIYIYLRKLKPYQNYILLIILLGLFIFLYLKFHINITDIPQQQGVDYSYVKLTDDQLRELIKKFFEKPGK